MADNNNTSLGAVMHAAASSSGMTAEEVSALASRKHHIAESQRLMKESEGTDLKGDKFVAGMDMALQILQEELELKKTLEGWDYAPILSVMDAMEHNVDDLWRAYLLWSQKDKDKAQNEFNVTKTVRRIGNYVSWMTAHAALITEPPLTKESIREEYVGIGSFVPNRADKQGRLVWFLDLAKCDYNQFRNNYLRMVVWLFTVLTFEPDLQANGMVMVDDLNCIPFMEAIQMQPPEVKAEVDRLIQGAGAIKMRMFVLANGAWWTRWLFKIISAFASKKITSRLKSLDPEKHVKVAKYVGEEIIPLGFLGIGKNDVDTDRFFGHKFSDLPEHHPRRNVPQEKKSSFFG